MSETPKPSEPQVNAPGEPVAPENKVNQVTQKIVSVPVNIIGGLGTVILGIITLYITADVIGRYILKKPIYGSDEMAGLLFLVVAACAFGYTQKVGRHIRIEMFHNILPKTGKFALDIFNYLVSFGISAIISWQMFAAAQRFILHLNASSAISEQLHLPFVPFVIILGVGFGLFALVILSNIIVTITKAVK
jgi:TRAP-type transport system small permease protein